HSATPAAASVRFDRHARWQQYPTSGAGRGPAYGTGPPDRGSVLQRQHRATPATRASCANLASDTAWASGTGATDPQQHSGGGGGSAGQSHISAERRATASRDAFAARHQARRAVDRAGGG